MSRHRRHGHANVTYAAEQRAARRAWPKGAPTLVPVEARRFAEQVVLGECWVPVEFEFYSGQPGRAWAYNDRRRISFSRRGLTKWIVLHELAHIATPDDRGHGREFRSEYLRLCRIYLPGFGRSLAAAFRWYGASFDDRGPQ